MIFLMKLTQGTEKKNVWRHLSKPEIPSLLYMKGPQRIQDYQFGGSSTPGNDLNELGGHQKAIRGQRLSALRSKVETWGLFYMKESLNYIYDYQFGGCTPTRSAHKAPSNAPF